MWRRRRRVWGSNKTTGVLVIAFSVASLHTRQAGEEKCTTGIGAQRAFDILQVELVNRCGSAVPAEAKLSGLETASKRCKKKKDSVHLLREGFEFLTPATITCRHRMDESIRPEIAPAD